MTLALAKIKAGGKEAKVQFNPASLRVTMSNQLGEKNPEQVTKATEFKLDVELLFDSTDDGSDVYKKTRLIRDAATASGKGATAKGDANSAGRAIKNAPPSLAEVTFEWGPSKYCGYIESINETLDYFSSDGVPLRATLQISIKGKTSGFIDGAPADAKGYGKHGAPNLPSIVIAPAEVDGTVDLTKLGLSAPGDNAPNRGVAAANGMESMRGGIGAIAVAGASAGAGFAAGAAAGGGLSAGASASAGIAVGGGAQLQAAAGFAMSGGISAGASIGFGIGASAGLSAGAGLGASVGVGMAAGIGGGIGGGISAGAGIGASAGIGIGASAGIGIGGSGGGIGMSASTSVTGFDGVTTTNTTSSVTGFDGVTKTTSSTTTSGSASAGAMASAGAFAGLGTSQTSLPAASFNPDSLLPPPLPAGGSAVSYDVSGRAISGDGQVAASWSAKAGVQVW